MVLSQSHELAELVELCLNKVPEPDLPAAHRPTVVVAIDGPAGAGKTTLSHHLAPHLTWEDEAGYQREAAVVHLDDLYAGWADGPSGGADRVAERVLRPLAQRNPGRYHRYDWVQGQFAEPHQVEVAPFVIIEGSGAGAGIAQVPELASVLVWLDADDQERIARVLARDGEDLRPQLMDWVAAEQEHFTADDTRIPGGRTPAQRRPTGTMGWREHGTLRADHLGPLDTATRLAGMMPDLLDDLEWRGLIAQSTDRTALREALDSGPVTFYTGFDPTAPSLHVGHLVQLLNMRRLQQAGHRPIALVGGATGLIGDPRETTERAMQPTDVVADWVGKIRRQIEPFFDFDGPNAAIVVNNLDWTAQLSAIELLRDVGKNFRLGTMLSKDIVARRLASEEGISYTEFSYQLLQANDFRELLRRYDCVLQVAGNDQWGNLVAGIDLIRKTDGRSVHALTSPLITKSDGSKMGKSEGGAVWLDPELLSPYAFYQYWINTADEDVVNYLKVFTFRSREDIEELERAVEQRPGAREAQRALAADLTTLVHGADATAQIEAASQALFGRGDLRELDQQTLAAALRELPTAQVQPGASIVDAMVAAELVNSKSAARRAIKEGGAYLNNVKIDSEDQIFDPNDLLFGKYAVLRRGKKPSLPLSHPRAEFEPSCLPTPATAEDGTRSVARQLHRPHLAPAPAWAMRALLGDAARDLLLADLRVASKPLVNEGGFRFQDAELAGALAGI